MKLGLGFHNQMLTPENFRFARQAGATHAIVHTPRFGSDAYVPPLWTEEQLRGLKEEVEAAGLILEGLENFLPAHWYDVLLDGPRKAEQMEGLKGSIRAMGRVGIPVMGYNFSIAGVWGRTRGPWARGGADSVGYVADDAPPHDPIPKGTVWNQVYDPEAGPGDIGTVTSEQLWSRLEYFLRELVPVAEEAGVRLAAHPDDPPLETVRGTARLVYKPVAVSAPPRHRAEPRQRPGVLPGDDRRDARRDGHLRGDRPLCGAGEARLRSLPQRQGEGAELPRGLHG